jgi:hypothetical protein
MDVIHPVYLPFTADHLRDHFAPVASGGDPDRHVRYYQASAARAVAFESSPPTGPVGDVAAATKLAHQIEKDERFWVVAALMRIFHASDRVTRLCQLLRLCLGDTPPVNGLSTWEDALAGPQLRLYFEVSLPSPKSYQWWLADHRDERVLLPWLRALAADKTKLEGATKADAMLIAPDTGFAVVFEAKVLSDASTQVGYDVLRNQIARNIDVLLDRTPDLDGTLAARDPDRSFFVLLTPQLFRENPEGRLYGWLMNGYRDDPELLRRHLPHRPSVDLEPVRRRLGWLTWEECNQVCPGACGWLT